jgi:hypothetical protein
MKTYKKTVLLLSFLVGSSVQAQQILDPTQTLQFSISREGMTRISIEGDGIDDIYAYPQEFADNIQQHKSGHAFVVAEDLDRPLYVTLVTKRGMAQDLKLVPASKKVEPILLKYETAETKNKEIEEEAGQYLKGFVQGMIPPGFYAVKIDESSRTAALAEGQSLVATVEAAHQNARYRVIVYRVHNTTNGALPLDHRLLWDGRDLAASFDQLRLEADQSGKLYVIQKL